MIKYLEKLMIKYIINYYIYNNYITIYIYISNGRLRYLITMLFFYFT